MNAHYQMVKNGADVPAWSVRDLSGAAGLTLLLFCILPLTNLLNQPDMDEWMVLRDVDVTALPPPPLPLPEVEPTPERVLEPVAIELPMASPPRMESPPPRPLWTMAMPSSQGNFGAVLDPGMWSMADAVFALGDVDAPPRPLVQAPPMYPHAARQGGLEGQVDLEFVVTVSGTVTDVRVVDARPGTVFVSAARAAVERWRFEPAQRGGEPVAVRVQIPLQFKLDR